MSTTTPNGNIQLKRAYDPPASSDGTRILVDRLWPRGVSKEALELDDWMKDIAPSTELRHWFGHDPSRWNEFCRKYAIELRAHQTQLIDLRSRAHLGRITFVYSAHDELHNNAVVLREFILHGLPR